MMPVPGRMSSVTSVYWSVSLNVPALICSKTSTMSGILIVLMVSIWRSASMAISSPVSSDLIQMPHVAFTLRVVRSIDACSRWSGVCVGPRCA